MRFEVQELATPVLVVNFAKKPDTRQSKTLSTIQTSYQNSVLPSVSAFPSSSQENCLDTAEKVTQP